MMPKTRKTKAARPATFPSAGIDCKIAPTSTGMPGTRLSARRGRGRAPADRRHVAKLREEDWEPGERDDDKVELAPRVRR